MTDPDTVRAFAAWQPDAACITAGPPRAWRPDAARFLQAADELGGLALHAAAAGRLTDRQIAARLREVADDLDAPGLDPSSAAEAVAHHFAVAGATLREIIAALVHLSVTAPAWPDPSECARIAVAAVEAHA